MFTRISILSALAFGPAATMPAVVPAQTGQICFYAGEQTSGMNKICFYNCVNGTVAITIKFPAMCPPSIKR